MEAKLNQNIHEVVGTRLEDGTYITPCPHAVAFEYINGWAYRMVGSCTCTACSYNASHTRNRYKYGNVKAICLHAPGEEPNKGKLSIFKNVKV